MKLRLLAVFSILSSPCVPLVCAARPSGAKSPPAIETRLGVPLKTQVTIEAEIVRAEDAGHKDRVAQYLLRVLTVDGVELLAKQVFAYSSGAGAAKLPTDVFELHKMKTGQNAVELTQEQIQLAEENFVGKKVTYRAAEVLEPRQANGKRPISTLLLHQSLP